MPPPRQLGERGDLALEPRQLGRDDQDVREHHEEDDQSSGCRAAVLLGGTSGSVKVPDKARATATATGRTVAGGTFGRTLGRLPVRPDAEGFVGPDA